MERVLLSSWELEALLRGERLLSLDLGVTYREYEIKQKGIVVCVEDLFCLPVPVVKRSMRRRGRVYELVEKGDRFFLHHLAIRDRHFYQLVQPERGKPTTLEIDGIHMHRVKDMDPYQDAEMKVRRLGVKKGELVWDTCTGLGYTAIFLKRRGALVVSTEKDVNVLRMAEVNPWSRELSEVKVLNRDAFAFARKTGEETFDAILHDPPRFSLAGELYSLAFYKELYRILKRGGRLYHYTGSPGRKRGRDIKRGVMKRLREAGFRYIRRDDVTDGVIARK